MNNNENISIMIGKLLNIGGMLQRNANKMLQPYNLNQQQFSILFEIGKVKKVQQKDMVNKMVLEKAHVSKVVKKLSTMGLVQIEISQEDKRAAWISLTPKGKDLLSQCRKDIQNWNSEWAKHIDFTSKETILDQLTQLQLVFKEELQ